MWGGEALQDKSKTVERGSAQFEGTERCKHVQCTQRKEQINRH